jgi:hypothetical protein
MRWLVILGLIGLTSCAYTRPIYFKNQSTGLVVVCGPFTHRDVQLGREQACIQKAAEDGLIRVRN